jgi:hypothetical protein
MLTKVCAVTGSAGYVPNRYDDPNSDMQKPTVDEGSIAELPEEFAVNPRDVFTGMIRTGLDQGCCGSDGLDGPNRACACGNVVATEKSDCWTQPEVLFLKGSVDLRD